MPHCIIEHSGKIDGEALVSSVYKGVLKSNLFEPDGSDIKVRAVPYSNFKTGNVDINFVHVTLKILSGRSVTQKTNLTHLVLVQLKTLQIANCSISVEIADIDPASYAKVIM